MNLSLFRAFVTLVFLLGIAAGSVVAQAPLRVDPIERPSTDRAHYQAETSCRFKHPFTEQHRTLTPQESAENAIHEAVHRGQLSWNCDSVMTVWDTDFVKRVGAEAQASCDGWKAGGVVADSLATRAVRAARFWGQYTTIGYAQAKALFDDWCSS